MSMELSTAIAFGIIKAIAIIAAFIVGAGILVFIIRAIPELLDSLIEGLLNSIKWLLKKWKWLFAFVAALTLNIALSETEYATFGAIVYLGFFLVAIGYYAYQKNNHETKSEEKSEATTTAIELNNDPYDDETFLEFLKRNKFYILMFLVIVIISNIF